MRYLPQDWYTLLCRGAENRRGGKMFWMVAAAFILALNLYAPAPLTLAERVLASAVILLSLAMIWYWTYRGGGEAEVGFLPAMLVVYLTFFGFPIFTQKTLLMVFAYAAYALDDAAVDKALFLSLLGLGLVICGYYWPGRRRVAGFLPRFRMQWRDKDAVQWAALFFMIVGLSAFVIFFQLKLPGEVQAYVSLPSDFFFLGMILLFIMQLQGDLPFIFTVLLWTVLIPARVILGMAQGQLGLGMLVVMGLVITYATIRRRIPWMVFFIGFGAFIVLQPVKQGLRQSIWVNNQMDNSEISQGDKAAALADSAQRGWTLANSFDLVDVISLATLRLADILVFSTLVARTPSEVPYWGGASYYRFPFYFIPRILYPDKPSYMEGNIFAHQYEMIAVDNFTTSVNIPQVVEFYGNFGPLGVVIGCLVLGVIYRTIADCFIHERCGMGAIVGAIYLFTHLLDIENSLAQIFGQLWIESITLVIFYFGVRLVEALFQAVSLKSSEVPKVTSLLRLTPDRQIDLTTPL
jgi:hypothetical protein